MSVPDGGHDWIKNAERRDRQREIDKQAEILRLGLAPLTNALLEIAKAIRTQGSASPGPRKEE